MYWTFAIVIDLCFTWSFIMDLYWTYSVHGTTLKQKGDMFCNTIIHFFSLCHFAHTRLSLGIPYNKTFYFLHYLPCNFLVSLSPFWCIFVSCFPLSVDCLVANLGSYDRHHSFLNNKLTLDSRSNDIFSNKI